MMKVFRIIPIVALLCCVVTACQESRGERIQRECADFTKKSCPQRMDDYGFVYCDSLVFRNDGTNDYIYYYSIHGDKEVVDLAKSKKEEFGSALKSGVINSVELKHIKAEGYNIIYRYLSHETGDLVMEYCYTIEDYR